MKYFVDLILKLDQTNKTNARVKALMDYFGNSNIPEEDKTHTLLFFIGKRLKRHINSTLLRLWAGEYAKLPPWLFEESYNYVGDLAETVALIINRQNESNSSSKSLSYWVSYINDFEGKNSEAKKQKLFKAWDVLGGKKIKTRV